MALARSSRWLRYASRSARSRATRERSVSSIRSIVPAVRGSRGAASGLRVTSHREWMNRGGVRLEARLVVQRVDHLLGVADGAHQQEGEPLLGVVVVGRGVVEVSACRG